MRDSNFARLDIQHRFPHILIDEFQDTNSIQNKLIRQMTNEKTNLMVVGDDDQSIYGWRGAELLISINSNMTFLNINSLGLSKTIDLQEMF